jgi:hypothetical protein
VAGYSTHTVCCAGLVCRYLPNGKFDLRAYDRLLDLQVANGVDGVIVGGTTGTHHASCIMHHASCIMHHASCIMHHASCIMHHASCIMHHASCIMHQAQTQQQGRHVSASQDPSSLVEVELLTGVMHARQVTGTAAAEAAGQACNSNRLARQEVTLSEAEPPPACQHGSPCPQPQDRQQQQGYRQAGWQAAVFGGFLNLCMQEAQQQ